jgi:hypothetical protein
MGAWIPRESTDGARQPAFDFSDFSGFLKAKLLILRLCLIV